MTSAKLVLRKISVLGVVATLVLGFPQITFAQTLSQSVVSPSATSISHASSEIVLAEFKGDVSITKMGEIQSRGVLVGEVVGPGDTIQTGDRASAKLIVEGAGELLLKASTTWSYHDYSVQADKVAFSSHLALGRLKAKVKKLPDGSTFEVKTPTAVAAVRGTEFSLFVYMAQEQYFTVLEVSENAVAFSNLSGDQGYIIGEGQSSTAIESGVVTPPQVSEEQIERDNTENDQTQDNRKKGDTNLPGGGPNPPGGSNLTGGSGPGSGPNHPNGYDPSKSGSGDFTPTGVLSGHHPVTSDSNGTSYDDFMNFQGAPFAEVTIPDAGPAGSHVDQPMHHAVDKAGMADPSAIQGPLPPAPEFYPQVGDALTQFMDQNFGAVDNTVNTTFTPTTSGTTTLTTTSGPIPGYDPGTDITTSPPPPPPPCITNC